MIKEPLKHADLVFSGAAHFVLFLILNNWSRLLFNLKLKLIILSTYDWHYWL